MRSGALASASGSFSIVPPRPLILLARLEQQWGDFMQIAAPDHPGVGAGTLVKGVVDPVLRQKLQVIQTDRQRFASAHRQPDEGAMIAVGDRAKRDSMSGITSSIRDNRCSCHARHITQLPNHPITRSLKYQLC